MFINVESLLCLLKVVINTISNKRAGPICVHDDYFVVLFVLTVFSNLLGDTILVDDLDSANHYRKGVSTYFGLKCHTTNNIYCVLKYGLLKPDEAG